MMEKKEKKEKSHSGPRRTCPIGRSEDIALVVQAAAVVAGVEGLGVFLPRLGSPEVVEEKRVRTTNFPPTPSRSNY